MNRDFNQACEDQVTQKVKDILQDVKPQQIPQLLMWKNQYDRTGLDCCLRNNDEESIRFITEHVLNTKDQFNDNSAHFTVLNFIFPYTAIVISVDLSQKILREYPEKSNQLLQAFTRCDKYTALHVACIWDNLHIVKSLLDLMECCTTDCIKQVLSSKNKDGKTPLDFAIAGKYGAMILLVSILAVRDTDTNTKLKQHFYGKRNYFNFSDFYARDEFAEVDSKSWQIVLNHLLKRIRTAEDETARLEKSIEKLRKEKKRDESEKQEALLENEKEKLKKYRSSLKYVPLVAAEKNKFGESLYDYNDLTPLLTQLLDIYQEYNMDCYIASHYMDLVPRFHFKTQLPSHYIYLFPRFHFKTQLPFGQAASINPLSVMGEAGNLAIIKHPYISSHVDAYWNRFNLFFYIHLGVYIYFLWFLIQIFFDLTDLYGSENKNMTSEIYRDDQILNSSHLNLSDPGDQMLNSSHLNLSDPGDQMLNSSHLNLSDPDDQIINTHLTLNEIGLISMNSINAILILLVYECVQIYKQQKHYFRYFENICDLFLFISTPSCYIIFLTGIVAYNKYVPIVYCILTIVAALRGAWMLKDLPYFGHKFRMLFFVLGKVLQFIPVLIAFINIFALAFTGLLQYQKPFDRYAFSILKVMAMSIGELDFNDMFFGDDAVDNVPIFEVLAFIIFFSFLILMPISMINLLLVEALQGVEEMSRKAAVADFNSKVNLILQYSYMLPREYTNSLPFRLFHLLGTIFTGRKRLTISDIESKDEESRTDDEKERLDKGKKNNSLQECMSDMEKEYKRYRVNSDAIVAVEEKVEETPEQSDIEDLKKQNDDLKMQVEDQNQKIEQLSKIVVKQSEQMDQLISHLIPKQTK